MRSTAIDRRSLVGSLGAVLGAAAVSGPAAAATRPFFQRHKLPIGIQLYTLGPDAAKDLDGTLKQVAAIGYRDVELAGFYGKTPKDFRASLDKAGLKSSSIHCGARPSGADPSVTGDFGKLVEAAHAVGAKTIIMPSPYIPDRLEQRPASGEDIGGWFRRVLGSLTADDWKVNADILNEKGAALKKEGLRIGYHNHNFEFAPKGGTNGIEVLFRGTDPALVTFELDIGWVAAAGRDPLEIFAHHKGRITQVHVKDIKASTQANFDLRMDPVEVGGGRLDWKALLPAAYASGVRGFFVEQEPPFARPRIEAARLCHDYLARVQA